MLIGVVLRSPRVVGSKDDRVDESARGLIAALPWPQRQRPLRMPVSAGSSSSEASDTTRDLLRAVNQQVNKLASSADTTLDEFDYVCECADSTCLTVVRLPRSEYARIAEMPGWFVVADGHDGTHEDVVERNDGYLVVVRHLD
jgi:hypothetical protein